MNLTQALARIAELEQELELVKAQRDRLQDIITCMNDDFEFVEELEQRILEQIEEGL